MVAAAEDIRRRRVEKEMSGAFTFNEMTIRELFFVGPLADVVIDGDMKLIVVRDTMNQDKMVKK